MRNYILSNYLGFRLPNEYVLNAVSTTSVIDCAFQCLNDECCSSITYQAASEERQKNCQLNIVRSLNYSGHFIRDEHADYYELLDKVCTVHNLKCNTSMATRTLNHIQYFHIL
jgi:hypothetical protein